PRICGICGQAHLKATVEALEGAYENAYEKLEVTNKAKILRQIGLNIETIDSHIKWFYMFILPDIIKLENDELNEYKPLKGKKWLEACMAASEVIKTLAIIGGQWPHSSYMIPGGVASDPTHLDLVTMTNYIDSAVKFFEDNLCGVSFDRYLSFNSIEDINLLKGDLKYFVNLSFENSLHSYGKSYNRFLSLNDTTLFKKGKQNKSFSSSIDTKKIKEHTQRTFELNKEKKGKHTWAKSVSYNKNFYETGPLARAILSKREFIYSIHKNYEDSVFTRVLARVDELAFLLQDTKELIAKIDLNEASYIKPKYEFSSIESAGCISTVEACRGSLYHNVTIENGYIKKYDVITPTVWNLGPQYKDQKGVAQKAIIGSNSFEMAKVVLRSFDVCSVCTTH
ncbi:MAG: nickel-dependent hydrogenase large subunit, partial [Campylobacterota bacterium]